MAMAPGWTEHTLTVSGAPLFFRRGGKGPPLLILPHDIGTLDRLECYDALAASHDVIVPDYAGWGRSPRQTWMRSVRDIAVQMQGLLAGLGIENRALLGLGFGGWVAAEMATMAPGSLAGLAVVCPFGIKPDEGYIMDQAIISYIDYPQAFFHEPAAFNKHYGDVSTDQLEAWDIAREMCFRLAWKPYMYSQSLPHLLGSVTRRSLIVWGGEDRVVPPSTANQWQSALGDARVAIVEGAGHAVEMEKPAELAKLVTAFLK